MSESQFVTSGSLIFTCSVCNAEMKTIPLMLLVDDSINSKFYKDGQYFICADCVLKAMGVKPNKSLIDVVA